MLLKASINSINSRGETIHTADQICSMADFLADNIFVKFGGSLFRQDIRIPVGPISLLI